MRLPILLIVVLSFSGLLSAQTEKTITMPPIEVIKDSMVYRSSDHRDGHDNQLPPWKEVKIMPIDFKKKPLLGEKVTIIPLDIGLAPFDLEIVKAEKKEAACDENAPLPWEIELKPLTARKFLEVEADSNHSEEYPFEVVIIYPSLKFARQIKQTQLTANLLPKGVIIKTVKAAIDVTNDGVPDILITDYCADDPQLSLKDCSLTTSEIYLKEVNGWKIVNIINPC